MVCDSGGDCRVLDGEGRWVTLARLSDRMAVITGAGAGIGKATARLFSTEGASIIAADVDETTGTEVVEAINQDGGNATFVRTDVSVRSDVQQLADLALAQGGADILFNNAGVEVVKSLIDTTEEEWDISVNVNLKSVFLCCKYFIPQMINKGGGVIINNASVAGLVGSFSPAYSASKGGVIGLTKALAVDLAHDNIRVNCICPGAIETPMLSRVIAGQGDPAKVREQRISNYPLRRFGEPEEVARTALFLASKESSFVAGAVIVVDGGFTAR